jgi:hypothetical protein
LDDRRRLPEHEPVVVDGRDLAERVDGEVLGARHLIGEHGGGFELVGQPFKALLGEGY